MTRYLPITIIGICLLLLVGLPVLYVLLAVIAISLVALTEDALRGGDLTSRIIKELKAKPKDPIVIHDVYVERDGTEDFKWKESTSSRNSSSTTIVRTGQGRLR